MTSAKEGRKHDTGSTASSKIVVPEQERHDFLHAPGEFACPQNSKRTAVPFGHATYQRGYGDKVVHGHGRRILPNAAIVIGHG